MLRREWIGWAIVIISILSGCGRDHTLLKTQEPVFIKPKGKVKFDYKIRPNDRVSVIIYKYPELIPTEMAGKGILVDANGYVALPLIHRVHIAGLTQTKAAKLLEKKFSKFIEDATLNLEVLNKRAYVLGEVRKPGVLPLDREKATVFEAIAKAGGLTDDALRDSVLILSHTRDGGNLELRKINLSNYHTLALTNLSIKPDDIVYVPPSGWKEFKIASSNFSLIFKTISNVASPFVNIKYLFK